MDNIIDRASYPLHEQEQEAQKKRRMGLGVTGLANTIEAIGAPYASTRFLDIMRSILAGLRDTCYLASAELAAEKGAFPLFDRDKYLAGEFVPTVSSEARDLIEAKGIRNSHLLSIAPTGTISFCADNVSSGIEPVFSEEQERTIMTFDGPRQLEVQDYGYKFLGTMAKTADRCTAGDHLSVLSIANYYMDSAVSKTCNIPEDFPWDSFKDFYTLAWRNGCKGCTTYRTGGLRGAILKVSDPELKENDKAEAEDSCTVNPITGRRSCE
jgi:ribonucleoside-diphosphate reductase alpha chain